MGSMKIVLIDDEPLQLAGMQVIVPWEQHGYKIVGTAHNGEEGIEIIKRLKPDIVVADIVMPRVNGLDMIRKIKESGGSASFIVLSCMNDIKYYKEAIRYGVCEYLQKELITPELLLETVNRVAQELQKSRILVENEGSSAILNERVLQAEFVNLVLQNQVTQETVIERKLQEWQILPKDMDFQVGAISVQRLGDGDSMLLEYSIISICEEILSREPIGRLLRVTDDYLVAFLPALQEEQMEHLFARMKDTVEQCMDCILTMGLSTPSHRACKLSEMFRQAKRAEELGYLYGLGKLYWESELENSSKNILPPGPYATRFSPPELHQELERMIASLYQEAPDKNRAKARLVSYIHRVFLLAEQTLPPEILEDIDRRAVINKCAEARTLAEDAEIIRRLIDTLSMTGGNGQWADLVDRIIQYVGENLYTKLSLNQIAQSVYSSPSHVSRAFKRARGINLNVYIREKKIEEAKKLLATCSVNEVAEQLGYASVSHFVSIFSKQEGVTPYKFKKQ